MKKRREIIALPIWLLTTGAGCLGFGGSPIDMIIINRMKQHVDGLSVKLRADSEIVFSEEYVIDAESDKTVSDIVPAGEYELIVTLQDRTVDGFVADYGCDQPRFYITLYSESDIEINRRNC